MPDLEGYPTEEELGKIRKWNVNLFDNDSRRELVEYVRTLWWAPDWGFKLKGKRVLQLELHTGGWSGNEDIIDALQHNYLFWHFAWERSTTGGHYWFRIIGLRKYKKRKKGNPMPDLAPLEGE